MVQATFTGKKKIGRINIERYRDSIRLRWQLQGKRYSLTIGKESKTTIAAALAQAALIDSDITFERFDPDGVTTRLKGLLYSVHSPQTFLIKWQLIETNSHQFLYPLGNKFLSYYPDIPI
ncbi:hypothetical protein NIES593_22345 [Hydrococcus rivularis NIES-593]|uniref:Min27-like integrase DNA-binding domain-containing protein n=1 Tax=Hydrococcus rivularis NIES-593 TaxID=1921803 RepID=A0A1U7H7G2_9CYAN|nr:hypothetical protein [Hydrococcus rivularis]OKH18262.1 hypothetical protein NIES593_22345 [Hydrococcus rivularis NIES-593]